MSLPLQVTELHVAKLGLNPIASRVRLLQLSLALFQKAPDGGCFGLQPRRTHEHDFVMLPPVKWQG